MANPHKGELGLSIGGRSFTLRLTTNACAELEAQSGLTIHAVSAGVSVRRIRAVRWFLWAALRDHHADVATTNRDAMDRIGDLVDDAGGLSRLVPVLQQLVALNAPPPVKSAGKGTSEWNWRDLVIDAQAHGLSPGAFWRLSMRELWDYRTAIQKRQQAAHDRDVVAAWLMVNTWVGSHKPEGKLQAPKLEDLLGRRQAPTADGLKTQLFALSQYLGIPVRKTKES